MDRHHARECPTRNGLGPLGLWLGVAHTETRWSNGGRVYGRYCSRLVPGRCGGLARDRSKEDGQAQQASRLCSPYDSLRPWFARSLDSGVRRADTLESLVRSHLRHESRQRSGRCRASVMVGFRPPTISTKAGTTPRTGTCFRKEGLYNRYQDCMTQVISVHQETSLSLEEDCHGRSCRHAKSLS
jgi:hypothetical protein